jgi:hypothetical protein
MLNLIQHLKNSEINSDELYHTNIGFRIHFLSLIPKPSPKEKGNKDFPKPMLV